VDLNKHIVEEIVHQVSHLPELYEDAWSGKYKISHEVIFNNSIHRPEVQLR